MIDTLVGAAYGGYVLGAVIVAILAIASRR